MSLIQKITHISVTGTKGNVIRMLNAAIRNAGTGNIIVDGDDIETINQKVMEEDGRNGLRIALPDLLDEIHMQDSLLIEKKKKYENLADSDDDEVKDFLEISSNDRMIDILNVEEKDANCSVEFNLNEWDECKYFDWLSWEDIARLYDCCVYIDEELYRNGQHWMFCGSEVLEPNDGEVKKTSIDPELDLDAFNDAFNKLIALNPERYRQLKIRYLEDEIERLRNEIEHEQVLLAGGISPKPCKAEKNENEENVQLSDDDLPF